ncbi:hypothetical protein OAG21_01870 [Akkermansiaceae bacterium]|nr:hypothetical protein [Akkermansiaceae bacterium]
MAVLFVSCGFAFGQGLNDGLVAYYPFNGNALDESGNGNVTEVVGATLTTGKDGSLNQAYLFDGVDDFIKCSIGAHQEVSVSLWYRSDEIHQAGDRPQVRQPYPTIFRYGGQPGSPYVTVGLGEGPWGQNLRSYLDIQPRVYDQVNTLGPLEQGVWRHAVVIKSASELTLYLDGELIDSVASTALLTGSDLYLGSSSIQTNEQNTDFLGAIDELRVYDRALTAAEIAELSGSPAGPIEDGLVAYYPFNGNANDESGNGNDLVSVNAVPTPDRRGAPGSGSYSFDGETSKLISTGYKGVTGSGARTISLWIKPSDAEGGFFFSYGTPTWETSDRGKDFRLGLKSSNTGVNLDTNWVGVEGDFPQPLVAGEWHHLVLTAEEGAVLSEMKYYLDGSLLASNWTSGKSPGSLNTSAAVNLTLGGEEDRGILQSMACEMDDIRIYNRSLTDEEISSLYTLESQNSQFQIIEGNFTWQEAKADAETKGGRLAVLDTQAKIDAANAFIQPDDPGVWIGLTDEAQEGLWKWITGEPLTVSNWYEGEPNNLGNEDYATIWSDTLAWNDAQGSNTGAYLLEILDQTPAVPFVAIDPLYESPSGESITLDATPTVGFPTEFTYQWCFNGFKIPANLGGTASSINIDNLQANEGTWSVIITNSEGIFEQDFEYRLYADSDSDGLSDGYEEVISKTDINNPDTDNDGLVDGDEVNTYSTNPNSPDSDSDGFTDLYELETAYDPNSAESVPDALVNIMTAIEVKFNAALGATYAIEFSTDNQTWDVIEDDIVGEGGAVERLYSKQNFPTGFFRVERRDQ